MIYRFDQFEVDDSEFRLRSLLTNEAIALEPKALHVLIFLLRNPNRLVRKQELLNAVWKDSFVSESTLTRIISLLRKLLGDDIRESRVIETVPTQGYRLRAVVATGPEPATSPVLSESRSSVPPAAVDLALSSSQDQPVVTATSQHARPANPYRRSAVRAAAVTVGLLTLGLLFALAVAHPNSSFAPAPQSSSRLVKSIAILPLAVRGSMQDPFLGDALAEEMATTLARYSSLRISSLTSTRLLTATTLDVPEMATRLQVDAVLEGSVVPIQNQMEINLRLIDAKSDRQIWSQQYLRDPQNLLGLPAQVSAELVRSLHLPMSPQDRQLLDSAQTNNPAAYDAFLHARFLANTFLLYSFGGDPQVPLAQAVTLLERAIRLDPNFAAAFSLLAKIYAWRVFVDQGDGAVFREQASAFAEAALRLDSGSSEAHFVRGLLFFEARDGFNYEAAVQEFKAAIALEPASLDAQGMLGELYLRVGLLDKAEQQILTIRALDPSFPPLKDQLGKLYFVEQRYLESFANFRDARNEAPAALSLFYLHPPDNLRSVPDAAVPHDLLDSSMAYNMSMDAIQLAASNHHALAGGLVKKSLLELRGRHASYDSSTYYRLGAVEALLGKKPAALRLLVYAIENGFPCYPLFASDPALDNLRTDPDFIDLLERLRIDWKRRSATL